MCGRYTLHTPIEQLAELFELPEAPSLEPRFNVAPTQQVPAVVAEGDPPRRAVRMMRWGLVPHWAKDPAVGSRMINARSETVAEKPAFRTAFRRRRCLIPADGFYEWQAQADGKQPYYIRVRDGRPFAFAGLWEHWEGPDAVGLESCTILTTRPNDMLAQVHDRMPVILPPEAYQDWLWPVERQAAELLGLLNPYPSEEVTFHPVSRIVNSPRNESAKCIEPLA